jgi:hypothetical protein
MSVWVEQRIIFDCTDKQFENLIETYCTKLSEEDIQEINPKTKSPDAFDFEKIVPIPYDIYKSVLRNLDDEKSKRTHNIIWGDWAEECWGTPFNTSNTFIDPKNKEISFVANCGDEIVPVLIKLSELIPFGFWYYWSCDYFNIEIGGYWYEDGDTCNLMLEPDEEYEIAHMLLGEIPWYSMDANGEWMFIAEEME